MQTHERRKSDMPVTQEQATWFADAFQKLVANVDKAIVGKDDVITLVLTALISDRHLPLHDYPPPPPPRPRGRPSTPRARESRCSPSRSPTRSTAPRAASSSPPTCCPRMSP